MLRTKSTRTSPTKRMPISVCIFMLASPQRPSAMGPSARRRTSFPVALRSTQAAQTRSKRPRGGKGRLAATGSGAVETTAAAAAAEGHRRAPREGLRVAAAMATAAAAAVTAAATRRSSPHTCSRWSRGSSLTVIGTAGSDAARKSRSWSGRSPAWLVGAITKSSRPMCANRDTKLAAHVARKPNSHMVCRALDWKDVVCTQDPPRVGPTVRLIEVAPSVANATGPFHGWTQVVARALIIGRLMEQAADPDSGGILPHLQWQHRELILAERRQPGPDNQRTRAQGCKSTQRRNADADVKWKARARICEAHPHSPARAVGVMFGSPGYGRIWDHQRFCRRAEVSVAGWLR